MCSAIEAQNKKLDTFDMWCLRRFLGILYWSKELNFYSFILNKSYWLMPPQQKTMFLPVLNQRWWQLLWYVGVGNIAVTYKTVMCLLGCFLCAWEYNSPSFWDMCLCCSCEAFSGKIFDWNSKLLCRKHCKRLTQPLLKGYPAISKFFGEVLKSCFWNTNVHFHPSMV